jgi:hypothetical protein
MSEDLAELRSAAAEFRKAIERSRAERASPCLPYFPEGACRLATWLLALHLSQRGHDVVRLVSGHIPGQESYVRHTWLTVNGAVVDLTADPFGEAPVVVGAETRFHASLDERVEQDASEAIAALSQEETRRYQRFLGPIEERLPG